MIGALVITTIAILILGINYLKGVNLFDRPQTYYAVYPNAGLITESNAVILNGFKIGLVSDVEMHGSGDGRVVVEFILDDNNLKVPLDSKLSISSDLLGTTAAELILGDSLVFAMNKDTLQGVLEEGLVKSLKNELMPLKDKAQQLIASVDEAVTNLNKIFGDTATKGLPKVFNSLQHTMENLESATSKFDNLVGANSERLNSIFSNVESITGNVKNNNEALAQAIQNISILSDTLAKLQLASTIRKVDKAMGDFAGITEKINSGEGSLGQLLNNDSLHTELVNASHDLDLLLNDMRMHPSRYLSFSLIGKKDKGEFSKKELEQMREEIDKAILEKEKAGG